MDASLTSLFPRWWPALDRNAILSGALRSDPNEPPIWLVSSRWSDGAQLDARYSAEIRRLSQLGSSAAEILDECRLDDARWALDALGEETWALISIPPLVRPNVEQLYETAMQQAVAHGRDHIAILLPATAAGFDAGSLILAEGLSVGFSPLVSPRACVAARRAFAHGLELAERQGVDPSDLVGFGIVPAKAVARRLEPDAGASATELVGAIDQALAAAAGSIPNFFLLTDTPHVHGCWLSACASGPLMPPDPTGIRVPEGLELAFEEAETEAEHEAYHRLLRHCETARQDALRFELSRVELRLGELDPVVQPVLASLNSEHPVRAELFAMLEDIHDALAQLSELGQLAEELLEAEVETVIFVAPEPDRAAADAFVNAFGQLDGAPELVVQTPDDPLPPTDDDDSSVLVVLLGLSDDRRVVQAAKRANLSPDAVLAVARPGSALERWAQDRGVLELLGPQRPAPSLGDRFLYTVLLPAVLLGVDADELRARLENLVAGLDPQLPADVHAALPIGALLAALKERRGIPLAVHSAPSAAGFGPWLFTEMSASSLPVSVEPTGALGLQIVIEVEGEPPQNPPKPTVRLQLPSRVDLAQEFLRWLLAIKLAERLDGGPSPLTPVS